MERTLSCEEVDRLVDRLFDGTVPVSPVAKLGFGGRTRVAAILGEDSSSWVGKVVTVSGWVKTLRKQGGGAFCFVAVNDGSSCKSIQVLVDRAITNYDELTKLGTGGCVSFCGEVVESPAKGQSVELSLKDPAAHTVDILGTSDNTSYPLAKKQHSREYLREIAHLRARSFLVGAVARVRSHMAAACHRFYQDRGFLYVHTPLITASDCEGAGEMFQVTTLMKPDVKDISAGKDGKVAYKDDFFGRPAFLTVSGQLNLETFTCGLSDGYTFGPAFRAENSHTSRHLAEFWMVEPEISFADKWDNMALAEACLKYLVQWALTNCASDLEWFEGNCEAGLVERLQDIVKQRFARISYTKAVEILKAADIKFQVPPEWGEDLGSEHERYLTDVEFKRPVVVYDYPKEFKSFYMRLNDDGKTVAAMDVLLPKVGEVIGGSQREERLDMLERMIDEKKLEQKDYWWYKDLRRYGTVPHAGFGLGFERLVMMVTGVENIRDVIPFPRSPGHAEF
eukprot:Polyplicarium_translucidae@DN3170_c0_g1_i3.p2